MNRREALKAGLGLAVAAVVPAGIAAATVSTPASIAPWGRPIWTPEVIRAIRYRQLLEQFNLELQLVYNRPFYRQELRNAILQKIREARSGNLPVPRPDDHVRRDQGQV